MKLNAKRTGKEPTVNPEGSMVYGRPDEIQLYLESSNLKIAEHSFYTTAKDKLNSVIKMANNADTEYVMGLAQFLADKGLKLSPVVLLSVLANKQQSFDSNISYIFNTPARIADAIALQNLKLVHLNNSFKKHALKKALESMSDQTLRKNKMRNRKVKLADLIKLLRPRPESPQRAALYRAIMENSKESKLDEKKDFLAMKSSSKIETTEKSNMLYDQVMKGRVPVNQLIRNLQYMAKEYDFSKQVDLQKKVIEQLNSINDYRFLNIFDVVQAAIFVPQFERALFEVVKKFVADVKSKFEFEKEATVLFDVSGSMDGQGINDGFRYLAVLSLLYDKIEIRFFSDDLADFKDKDQDVIRNIQKGAYQKAKECLREVFNQYSGGTALADSAEKLLDSKDEFKNLIVISDEVSWVEGDDLRVKIKSLQKKLEAKNTKLVLINPTVYKGTVFSGNVLGIASLTSAILLDFVLVTNPIGFVKYIKSYKHGEQTA